jgi:hypothetical protein
VYVPIDVKIGPHCCYSRPKSLKPEFIAYLPRLLCGGFITTTMMMMDGSADLKTPFLPVSSGSCDKNEMTEDENGATSTSSSSISQQQPLALPAWVLDRLVPMSFFPLIAVQFWILVHFNTNLSPWPVVWSVNVFIVTAVMYGQILSESPALEGECWLVMALLPELSVFAMVTLVTLTVNAVLAFQALLVATIVLASVGACITVVQIWQHAHDSDDDEEEEVGAIENKIRTEEAFDYALVFDC